MLPPRRQRHFKKKIVSSILFMVITGLIVFIFNLVFSSGKPLYISPVGKPDSNKNLIEKILKEKKIPYSGLFSSNNYYFLNIENNGQVKLSPNKDITKQLSSLQKILNELTIEGKPFKIIDFRFDEPVVSF